MTEIWGWSPCEMFHSFGRRWSLMQFNRGMLMNNKQTGRVVLMKHALVGSQKLCGMQCSSQPAEFPTMKCVIWWERAIKMKAWNSRRLQRVGWRVQGWVIGNPLLFGCRCTNCIHNLLLCNSCVPPEKPWFTEFTVFSSLERWMLGFFLSHRTFPLYTIPNSVIN